MNPLAIFAGPYAMIARWAVIGFFVVAAMGWSYTRGVSRESDRRDALELAQIKIESGHYANMVAFGSEKAKLAAKAQADADDYHQLWKEERDAAKRSGTPLAVADCPTANPKPNSGGSGLASSTSPVRLRLTWELVGLWDSAHTDSYGKPLFGDTARVEKAAAGSGAASPYTLDDLTDNHGENAKRWGDCRRDLRALNATIDGMEKKWDAQHAR